MAAEDLTIEAERWEATKGPSYPNGAHVAEVEIDPETGALTLCRYLAVEDIGRVINPMLAHGQLHGGVAQGAGQALMEAIRHDPDSGQMLSGSFMDYAMPRAGDLPFIDIASMPTATASNTLGTKGAGEAGTVGALPAIASAIADALAPWGIEHVDMPATPAAIWQAIRDAEARQTVTSSAAY
jgi:carbon-monoxide dehydrogenase large subunit